MDIKFSHVSKVFGRDTVALEDVTTTIRTGEFVYLIGATGSGKSTFMKTISCEVLPTSGKVTVGDYDLALMSSTETAMYKRNLGIIYQDFALLPQLTAFENIAFILEILGLSPQDVKYHAGEVLHEVGLWSKKDLLPSFLSGGEQQRLAIARAIVTEPDIILADEPTASLDPRTAGAIMDLLFDINAAGTTIIVSTHNMQIVNDFRHRVIELSHGCINRDDPNGGYSLCKN